MQAREAKLSRTFVTLADTLVTGFDLTDLLSMLASTCVELLDVDAAGIMLADQAGSLRVVGCSDERMRLLELFELQHHQGPCMDCYVSGRAVAEPDLEMTDRWPLFTPEALREGIAAVDAVPLRLRQNTIGALNLFHHEVGAMTDDERHVAQALADVAAIGLIQERLVRESQLVAEQLQRALNSRVIIEQAKGILAEQGSITMDEAFETLRTHSRNNNIGITDVARDVIDGRHDADTLQQA